MIRDRRLKRFLVAQDKMWLTAYQELLQGEKRSHWMWFIFPQKPGLGRSDTSKFYALKVRQARRYAQHPILGGRLRAATGLAYDWLLEKDAVALFGNPIDAQKFRSSMELFWQATGEARFRLAYQAAQPSKAKAA